MKKLEGKKLYVVAAILTLWVGTTVYLLSGGRGSEFQGQFLNAPQTCDQILVELAKPDSGNATGLIDTAFQKDCPVSNALLDAVEQKLISEQTSGL